MKTLGQVAYEAWCGVTEPSLFPKDWEKAALAVIAEHEARKWKRVEDGLPESGVLVVAFIRYENGNTRRIRACYAAPNTLEVHPDAEDEGATYNEETDTYYCSEGWYEQNEYEEIHWAVTDPVTHWQPLPAPPKEERSNGPHLPGCNSPDCVCCGEGHSMMAPTGEEKK